MEKFEQQPKQEFIVPEKFEGSEYEEEKKKYDPLRAFLFEKGINPDEFNLGYKVVEKIEKDPEDPEKISAINKIFNNYHDFLKFQKSLTDEQRVEFIGTSWTNRQSGQVWINPSIVAEGDFWKRLHDETDILYKYKDEIEKISGKIKIEEFEDEYAKAVECGNVEEVAQEKTYEEKFLGKFKKGKKDKKEKPTEKSKEKTKEKEKSPEEISLNEKRGAYVGAYTENRFKGFKEKELAKFEKDIEPARKFIEVGDSERLKLEDKGSKEVIGAELRKQNFISDLEKSGVSFTKAEAIYGVELKKAEYEAAKIEAGKKMAEQGIKKGEIFQKLFLQEHELLGQQKIESWPPKEKGIFRKGMEWYMRRGTATRLLISTGLVTAVVAGVGGFGAAAAATFAGYRFVRGFGSVIMGKLAGKGVDWIMSKGIIAQKEASLEKLKSGFDLSKLKETEKELEKIFEETAKKERRKLLIKGAVSVMAGAGAAIGMGMLEHAYAAGGVKVAPEAIKPKAGMPPETLEKPVASATETPQKPSEAIFPEAPVKTQLPTEAQQPVTAEIETPIEEPPVEKIIDYQGGKSIWQEAGKQWETRFKEFADLGGGDSKTAEALKTYNIDRIKDTVADAIKSGDKDLIEKYGLTNISDPDNITVDQLKGVKWNNVFEDTLKEKGLTEDLPSEQVESIVKNNATLREFFKEYPAAPRTSGNYENILRGKGDTGIVSETIPASETPGPEPKAEPEIKIESEPAVETKPVLGEKIADLDKQITNIKTEYDRARLNLLEANVERHSPTREWSSSEELENYINSHYQKVEDLENQLKALNQNRDGLLKLTEEQIISPEMETGAVIEEAPKVLKEVSEISLAPEKAGILDNIIQDKFISDAEINQVWNNLKSNKLTPDDFIDYYSQKLNESGIKFENDSVLKKGFKEIFNNYIKETDSALKAKIEIGKIKPALKVLLNRLAKQ